MQESYFVICFNLDHRRYAIDQGRIFGGSLPRFATETNIGDESLIMFLNFAINIIC